MSTPRTEPQYQAQHDASRNPALIAHSDTTGTAYTTRVVADKYGNLHTTIGKSTSLDAFSRLRTSNPVTVFDSQNQYDMTPLLWENTVGGAGTPTHSVNESCVVMSTGGTASGDYVYRQTKQYFRYQPGKSQLIVLTGVPGSIIVGRRQRWGCFDSQNGLFFEQNGTTLNVVRRTNTSGTVTDNVIPQGSWSGDSLSTTIGTTYGTFNLDTTKANVYFIDFQWLGVGRVRFGVYDGEALPLVAHEIDNANTLDTVYMTTGNLPVRFEIENTANCSPIGTMKQICTTVISEGGFETERGLFQTANTGTNVTAVTGRRSVLSIRPSGSFNGIVNRAQIETLAFDILGQTGGVADIFYEIVYNPTFSGTPTWTAVGTSTSCMEYSTHGTPAIGSVSGGVIIDSGYIEVASKATGQLSKELISKLPVVLDTAGSTPIPVSIVCSSMGASVNVAAAFNWKEIK